MSDRIEYHGFWIQYDPPAIPVRAFDWQYWHKDYDGPEDGRCGTAPSLEQAQAQIREYWFRESRLNCYQSANDCFAVASQRHHAGRLFTTYVDALEYIAAVTSQNPNLLW